MGSSLLPPGSPYLHCVVGQETWPWPQGPRDEVCCCTEPCALNPRQALRCHRPKDALAPSAAGGSRRNRQCCRSTPGPSVSALPQLQAIFPAPWQCSWLALSQGLSSMGGRPCRGSEAWEMFIAWPQRHWRAIRERHRAKAAQAALQSQISSSKGQSRGGEEKPLLANIRKFCLSQLKSCRCGCAGQGNGGRQRQGKPCPAGAEGGVAWDVGDGWGLWEPMVGRAGCGTALWSSKFWPAALSWCWREVMLGGCPWASRQRCHLLSHSAVPFSVSQTVPVCPAALAWGCCARPEHCEARAAEHTSWPALFSLS